MMSHDVPISRADARLPSFFVVPFFVCRSFVFDSGLYAFVRFRFIGPLAPFHFVVTSSLLLHTALLCGAAASSSFSLQILRQIFPLSYLLPVRAVNTLTLFCT